jgi:uncharacterized phiE125 gp8 family phage protein
MMRVFVVTPPVCEPISLNEAKAHLRITHAYEDAQITRMIRSARDYCEQYTRRALITQTLTAVFAGGRDSTDIWLPREPIQSVTAVEMDSVPVNSGAVSLRTATVCVPANVAEYAKEIAITYIAGFGDKPEDVPSQLRDGMLRQIASLFNNRGDLEGDSGHQMASIAREYYTQYRTMTVGARW